MYSIYLYLVAYKLLLKVMYPSEFTKRLLSQEYIDSESLINSLNEPAPISFRINPFKWNYEPLDATKVSWAENGYFIEKRPSFTLDPLFHSGCYYPQEASSMFIEQVFKQLVDEKKQLRILDLCAAPGGKSTHLSTLIGNEGVLIANEVIRSRASILMETLTKWGIGNVLVTQNDPSAFSCLEGYFDVILVDAPCSGEGMFRDEVARNNWSEMNANLCSERQKRILSDIWQSLKENGLLIYCTCTFNPSENEKIVEWLVENRPAEIVLLDINRFPAITPIDCNGVKGYSFLPYKTKGDGFFLSVLRKKEEVKPVKMKNVKVTESKPTDKEKDLIKNLSLISEDRLLKNANEIWALPCDYNEYNLLNQSLKIIKHGVKLATIKQNDIIPSHDLALSTDMLKSEFHEIELGYGDAISFLKRDSLNIPTSKRGWIILKYKGINLGWAKNIGTRINNYYPVDWRIRMNVANADKSNIIKWKYGNITD